MTEIQKMIEMIHSLLYTELELESPVLSGNMKSLISESINDPSDREILIEAPFYDQGIWQKTGAVVHTGQNYKGITDYSLWVNLLGGFATHNKSQGWVNRCITTAVDSVANIYGAEVIYDLSV